jgi:hypothetical protein
MNNFIKLSEVKEKKLRREEMMRINGGDFAAVEPPPIVPDYGVIPDPLKPKPTPD